MKHKLFYLLASASGFFASQSSAQEKKLLPMKYILMKQPL